MKETMAKTKKATAKKQANNQQMVWLGILAVVVVLGITLFSLLNNNNASSGAASLPREISVDQALEKREAGAFILDVREQDEWNTVHIPGATLIPLGQLANRLAEVPKDQEVVVVCRSGNRSQEGRNILLQAGFEQVTSMGGGMNDWTAKGYPTTTGP
jgi:rhodanese-related sulfurtransferase